MKALFKDMFQYHHHYNQLFIDLLQEHDSLLGEEPVALLSHVVNAHQIWNARITDSVRLDVYEMHTPDEMRLLDRDNYESSIQIIDGRDLAEDITYTTTKGQSFSNSLQEILFHVVNHSTHHKAQISRIMRQKGMIPPRTDYIFYKRE